MIAQAKKLQDKILDIKYGRVKELVSQYKMLPMN